MHRVNDGVLVGHSGIITKFPCPVGNRHLILLGKVDKTG